MDFLSKLFPFQSLITGDINTLTAWWVIITVVMFFVIPLVFLFKVTRKLKHSLKLAINKFSETELKNNILITNVWNDYAETLIDFLGERKTDEYAYDYFNENNLLAANTNLKLLTYIPNALVGVGILGTFVGLTAGVSNFKTESTEAIKNSIEILLAGMGTAFVSSIWGMFLSIIYSFIEKTQIHSLHNSLHALCYKLDKTYKVSKDDERNFEWKKHHDIIQEYFIYTDEQNNKIKPSNIFRDIYRESVKQSTALQSFSTDLASKIEAGFESILSQQIQHGVIPELQGLRSEIELLGQKIQSPASEMTQSVVKNLEVAMEKMLEEFKSTVSENTKTELENIAVVLGNAGGVLNDFPQRIHEMTDNLNDNFQELQKIVQQIAKQTLAQSNESTEQMKTQVSEMSEIFKNKIGELQIGQEILLNKQTDNWQLSEKVYSSFNQSIENITELSQELGETISQFNAIQNNFKSISTSLEKITVTVDKTTSTFDEAQKNFTIYSDEFLETYAKTLENIDNTLDKSKEISDEYVKKFEIIEAGLKNIFEQIQKGLDDYGNTIGDGTKEFLDKYTEALTKTTESLASASTRQEDLLEELTDLVSKIRT